MAKLPPLLRKTMAWTHLWMGLLVGLFFCLVGVTGTIVTFRPQIASMLSPRPDQTAACRTTLDWNQAQQQIESSVNSQINRIYFPSDGDPRYHFRMMTPENAIYTHVIYDVCAGRVLGTANLEWLDWIVDLHHNFLNGNSGRQYVGAVGLVLFLSSLGGLVLWLMGRPSLKRAFRVQTGVPVRRTMFDLHRSVGLAGACLLLLQAFTGLWLCYPQPLRSALDWVSPSQPDVRTPKSAAAKSGRLAGLNEIIVAAQKAIPDGAIREIRMPTGYGNVQVRMWRPGDFRSLGNNVATVDRATANVLSLDLYSSKPGANRFIQAMAGLHYGEWGGFGFRAVYGIAGLATVPLFLTGLVYWWLGRRRTAVEPAEERSPIADRA